METPHPRTNFRTIEIDYHRRDPLDELHRQIKEKLEAIPLDVFHSDNPEGIMMIIQKQGPRPPKK